MPSLFSDDFAAGLSGTNWQNAVSSASRTFSASGGAVTPNGIAGDYTHLRTTTSAHAAVADAKVTCRRVSSSPWDGGPSVRGSGGSAATANDTCYYFDPAAGGGTADVYRRVAGTDSSLGSVAISGAANDTYAIEVSGSGATVTVNVYQNGSLLGTFGDTNAARITAAGQCGMVAWALGTYDDFSVETPDPPSGYTPDVYRPYANFPKPLLRNQLRRRP